MAKPQKKSEPVRITEAAKPKQVKKPAVPRKRDPKKTPSYVVLNKGGEIILSGQQFTKFRLARRAAQRYKSQGGQPAQIRNQRTGEAHLFIPFSPKPKAPEPSDPAVAEREYASI